MIEKFRYLIALAIFAAPLNFAHSLAAEEPMPDGDFLALFEACSSFTVDGENLDYSGLQWLTFDQRRALELNAPGRYFYVTDTRSVLNLVDRFQCVVLHWGTPTSEMETFFTQWAASHTSGIRRDHDVRGAGRHLRQRYFSDGFEIWLTAIAAEEKSAVTFVRRASVAPGGKP